MAAKPIERHVKRQIQEQGGWPRILERIASGDTDYEIAQTLPKPDGTPISRSFFNTLLHHNVERQVINDARREAGGARVDHAIEVAKTAPHDRDAIQKAKLVIDTDLRVAGFLDRETYGEQKQQVNVSVNVNSLHVDALRHRVVEAVRPIADVVAREIASSTVPRVCETDTHHDSEGDSRAPSADKVDSVKLIPTTP
jgi:hypothetical protein